MLLMMGLSSPRQIVHMLFSRLNKLEQLFNRICATKRVGIYPKKPIHLGGQVSQPQLRSPQLGQEVSTLSA
jgi:hypothetical protein